jgi:TonB family protein
MSSLPDGVDGPGSPDLKWPPPDADIDAVEVIDLGAGTGPVRDPVIVAGGQLPVVPAAVGSHRRRSSRRRHHLWILALGLILMEVSDRHLSRIRHAATGHQAPPTAVAMLDRPLSATPATGPSLRRAESDSATRADVPRAMRSRAITHSHVARVTGLVPPRAIATELPRRLPTPFPVARGSHTSLELVIDDSGRVSSARVSSSSTTYFDAPLLAAAKQWRFEPARVGGQPTRAVYTIDIPLAAIQRGGPAIRAVD